MKSFLFKYFFFLGLSCLSLNGFAQLSLPQFFSDHMVLQREKPITIWGKAGSGDRITISLGNQTVNVKASKAGEWKVSLQPMEAGGPYVLTVKSGKEAVKFDDVLIGEVWLCSGQSNMEFRVRSVINADEEIANADYSRIRSFNVEQEMAHAPKNNLKGNWKVCSSQTVADFSAVGYFFAREIYEELNIPIGFINSSWGGTDIETWMSMEVMDEFPKYTKALEWLRSDEFEKYIANSDVMRAEFEKAIVNEAGISERWYAVDYDKSDWKSHQVPELWSNDELIGLDGVVWSTYSFSLPSDCIGKEAVLSLGPIDDDDITWLNGVEVGQTVGYDVKRYYKVPANILKEQNEITIKITDYRGGGGLYGKPDNLFLKVGERVFPLSGNWKYKIAVSSDFYDYVEYGPNAFPSLLYNGMIHPLVGYAMRGVIWYQGENNAGRSDEYYTLFPAMINDWRSKWGGDFSFYWVQLANFMESDVEPRESHWANLRNAQSGTLVLPNTGQAVIIDIGEADDIHPRNKQDVGKRLAYHALNKDYGYTDIVCSGPVFESMEIKDNTLLISFSSIAEGLVVKNKYSYLSGFAIAGEDGKYKWARAKVEGDKVIVWNDSIESPISVRYAWGDNPDDANLYNSVMLPASPFEASLIGK